MGKSKCPKDILQSSLDQLLPGLNKLCFNGHEVKKGKERKKGICLRVPNRLFRFASSPLPSLYLSPLPGSYPLHSSPQHLFHRSPPPSERERENVTSEKITLATPRCQSAVIDVATPERVFCVVVVMEVRALV